MKHGILCALFSFFAPGAGQAALGRYRAAAGFALGAFFWSAAGGPAVLALLLKAQPASPAVSLVAMLLPSAGFLLISLAAAAHAWSAAAGADPVYRRGLPVLVLLWAAIPLLGTLLNRGALRAAAGPEGAAALEQAAAGQAAADRLAEEIRNLPPGPFAHEIKDGVFYDREKNSFALPSGYTAVAEPDGEDRSEQQVLLYPGQLYKEMELGRLTVGELMKAGLIFYKAEPLPAGQDGPGALAMYGEIMHKSAAENPAWKARVSARPEFRLPALLFETEDPPQAKLYLFGGNRMFVLRGASFSAALQSAAGSLKEGPPPEKEAEKK